MMKHLLVILIIFQPMHSLSQSRKPHRSQPPTLSAKEIAASILPSVVLVAIDCADGRRKRSSFGSGFFVTEELVATNRHVVECGQKGIVKFRDQGPPYPIATVWTAPDEAHDLALVKVEGVTGKPLRIAKKKKPAIGEKIYAAGNPQGLEGTFSDGIISQIRNNEGLIQFTAPISPGSSGGPVVDESGSVIGITMSFVHGQNLNFAVQAQYLMDFITDVQRGMIKPQESAADKTAPRAASVTRTDKSTTPVTRPRVRTKEERPRTGLNLVLALDCSNSIEPAFAQMVDAARQLIDALDKKDEASIVRFSGPDQINAVQDFTSDHKRLHEGLDKIKVDGGATALIDALYLSVEHAAYYTADKGGRPAIVLITDGDDRQSFHRRASLLGQQREKRVPVYIIGLVSMVEAESSPFLRKNKRERAIELLSEIAKESGGRVYFPSRLEELPEIVREINKLIH